MTRATQITIGLGIAVACGVAALIATRHQANETLLEPSSEDEPTASIDTASGEIDSLPAASGAPPGASRTRDADASGPVHIEVQNVDMHFEPGIVLRIDRLRGTVLPLHPPALPSLDKKGSMRIDIASADIVIDSASLTTLLNRHVFGYAHAPLRKLRIAFADTELVQTGVMHKGVDLPFRIRAVMSLTPDGDIRVHPVSVKVLGIGVKGLTNQLGGLSKLITLEPGHGARLDGNDIILSVEEMLPPPKIRGRLTSVRVVRGGIRQRFGAMPDSSAKGEVSVTPLHRNGSTVNNFMYFHGGTLRFGKLTMRHTDLEIVDMNQENRFDYDLDRYLEHLVAGRSNTTPVDGLIVHMPDVSALGAPSPKQKPRAR